MDDLKLIKKHYGEKMMHLCKKLFPSLIEIGNLYSLIDKNFAHNKALYDDLIMQNGIGEFKHYIYSLADIERRNRKTIKSPEELLSEVGYDLYECKCEDDIQKFKKYYAKDEELCTFDGNRLKTDYVFFAVKKDVDMIKREDFIFPEREDNYGTSVISIQFDRNLHYVSIKNRYNDAVLNPDATFNNDLDNIIEGLTNAFEKKYNLYIKNYHKYFDLDGYICVGNKYYKYNYKINGIYYCLNNIVIHDDKIDKRYINKARYIFLDYFILDLTEKKIFSYEENSDCFLEYYNHFDKIKIEKINNNRTLTLTINNHIVEIIIDRFSNIISFKDNELDSIKSNFLVFSKYLKCFMAEKVKKIDSNFLSNASELQKIYMPLLEEVGNNFNIRNKELEILYLPNLKKMGNNFLRWNEKLKILILPILEKIESGSLISNKNIDYLVLENVEEIIGSFLSNNQVLETFVAPKLKYIDDNALISNDSLKYIEIPYESIKDQVYLFNSHRDKEEIINNLKENGVWYKEYVKKKVLR